MQLRNSRSQTSRTGVRGFAGLCLTTRPPRRHENIVSSELFVQVGLRGSDRFVQNRVHARRCEPCPGVDTASVGRSPGPLPGLHLFLSSRPRSPGWTPAAAWSLHAVETGTSAAPRAGPRARRSASSPVRACRNRSLWRSRTMSRWSQAEACGPPLTVHRTAERAEIFPPGEHCGFILLRAARIPSRRPAGRPLPRG